MKFSIIILLFGLLTGCKPYDLILSTTPTSTLDLSMVDRSILTDSPCRAPCWYGLLIGQSNRPQARSILNKLMFININTLYEGSFDYWNTKTTKESPGVIIEVDCKNMPGIVCIRLEFVNDVLVTIRSFPIQYISLFEVVNHLGSPDYFRAVLLQDNTTCMLLLSWPSRQIMIEHDEKNDSYICKSVNSDKGIKPNIKVDGIYYEQPDQFDSEKELGKPWIGFVMP